MLTRVFYFIFIYLLLKGCDREGSSVIVYNTRSNESKQYSGQLNQGEPPEPVNIYPDLRHACMDSILSLKNYNSSKNYYTFEGQWMQIQNCIFSVRPRKGQSQKWQMDFL
jgi:hypothetical protein